MAELESLVAPGNNKASDNSRASDKAVDLRLPELAHANRLAHRFLTRLHLEQEARALGEQEAQALVNLT